MGANLLKLYENLRRQRARAAGPSERGMTLIEIMVVIVIIGVLGSVLAFGVFGSLKDAKLDLAKHQVKEVHGKARMYLERHDSLDNLSALGDGKNKDESFKDPWKTPLTMSGEGEDLTICSAGPDKKPGTEDDICEPSNTK